MFAYRAYLCQSMLLLAALWAIDAPVRAAGPDAPAKQAPRVDEFGDPLPQGAVARIGTVRLRQPSEVCSIVYSPDGKLLATGGRYDGVRLWDAATGKAIRFLPAQGGQGIFYLSFAPDNKTLVSSGVDGALEVWDVATGKKSRQLGEKAVRLGPICFSDDGKLLAVADGQTMRVWDAVTWTEQKPQGSEDKKVRLASFAGRRMFVSDERLGKEWQGNSLWDLASLEKRAVPKDWHTGYGTVLSPDGKRIAVSGWSDGFVLLRDVATGKELHRLELAGKKENTVTVTTLCFSADGKLLAIGGRGIDMRCIDAETGKEIQRFGEQQVDYATQIAFSPDGKRLAAARGPAIRLWEVGTGKELFPSNLRKSVHAIAFSPNGKQLVFGDGDWLRLCDTATRKPVWRCSEEWDNAQRIAFAPDGKTLVAGDVSRLRFFDALTGKATHSWGKGVRFHDFRDPVELALFTPDLAKVVSLNVAVFGNPDTDVLVLSATTGKELLKFQRLGKTATAASISPDGQLLAIGERQAPGQLYRIANGTTAAPLETTGTAWHSLAFAPDGRSLASMDQQGVVQLLETATGKLRLEVPSQAENFVFSPDGDTLATWGNKRTASAVELWDTLTGRKHGRLDGHNGGVNQAAFAPGGTILATAGQDTTILLWDVADLVRRAKPMAVTSEALTSAWQDLGGPNAANAYRAMATFRRAGAPAVDFLRERLRPEQAPPAQQIDRWVKDLDDEKFAVRDAATRELQKCIDSVAPSLRKALAAGPSPEVRGRLTQLIELAQQERWPPEALRTLRAMEILEHIGSAEARTVLEALAGGVPEARLTRQAKASLERTAR